MSGLGSATVSRNHGGDRFYNPPPLRRQQQLLLEQQQMRNAENRAVLGSSGGSAAAAALPRPPSEWYIALPPRPLRPPSPRPLTNLDRFIEAVTPSVPARFSSEVQANARTWRGVEPELKLFYCLGDLWDSFGEWSVYGVGVPLVLNGEELIVQYYVPFLSGIQLYVDPVKIPSRCRETGIGRCSDYGADRLSGNQQSNLNPSQMSGLLTREKSILSSDSDEVEACYSPGTLVFEYMEGERPYNRRPLADQMSTLASEFPDLRKYKSCDLLPSSWISVAWYPIYRIPVGPTLKDLNASFLTFHSLSTNSIDNVQPRSHGVGGRKGVGGVDDVLKIPLPVFGLASYKLKGSILSPSGPLECEQEDFLSQAADSWLRNLQAFHPDYQFFVSHYSQW